MLFVQLFFLIVNKNDFVYQQKLYKVVHKKAKPKMSNAPCLFCDEDHTRRTFRLRFHRDNKDMEEVTLRVKFYACVKKYLRKVLKGTYRVKPVNDPNFVDVQN